ncbi:MAG: dihydrofolate reductase [Gammaproteobacteria bacterium]
MAIARPLISIVVAATENDVIGRDNGMPWHLPDDLKYFKARTMGKPMLMGRKTFESIGKPLPGRTSVVLTRDPSWHANGVVIVRSLDEAKCWAEGMPELCAIGGAEIFHLVMPLASRLFLTRIHTNIPGDTFFPKIDASEWREVERTEHPADARHAYAMSFVTLDRVA